MPKYPERIEVRDDAVLLDGVEFPYHIQDPATEGFDLVEAVDDHHLILNLKVLFHPRETTVFEDRRAAATVRRRRLAAAWCDGFNASMAPPEKRYLVTSDHSLGNAWAAGFRAYLAGQVATSNPHILDGETPNGSPKP